MKYQAMWSKFPWMNFPDVVKFNSLDIKNAEEVFVKIKESPDVVLGVRIINCLDVKNVEEVF